MINAHPSIVLIPSQMPQQELGLIAQVLQSQGFAQQPPSERAKASHALIFQTPDKTNQVVLKFFKEIGALRLELTGDISKRIAAALSQYMESLTADTIAAYFASSQSDMERRIYAILLILTYPNAALAMAAVWKTYLQEGNEATREGIIQGLAFLETPDVGQALESIEAAFPNSPIAQLSRKAIDALCARGLIRESHASFEAKIRRLIEENPAQALEQIELYTQDGTDAPLLRALLAKALMRLGRIQEASAQLERIHTSDPDAADAYCVRADIQRTHGLTQEALDDASRALALVPNHAEARRLHDTLAMLLTGSPSDDSDKIERLTRALENTPNDADILYQRAEAYAHRGEHKNAIDDLQAAKKIAPNDPRLPLMLGTAYLAMGWLGSALEQASHAQKVHLPSQALMARLLKVRVFLALDRPQQALSSLRELPPERHTTPQYQLCLGILEERLDHLQAAQNAYNSIPPDAMASALHALSPRLYADLPILRDIVRDALPPPQPHPAKPLDNEPIDPYFKRCDACGALTMMRRTLCRECANATFFEN